jgi:3-isopropylmalate dehydratase small subunit
VPSDSFAFRLSPFAFSISSFRKECLINGLDLIDYLAALKPEIEKYEQSR